VRKNKNDAKFYMKVHFYFVSERNVSSDAGKSNNHPAHQGKSFRPASTFAGSRSSERHFERKRKKTPPHFPKQGQKSPPNLQSLVLI